MLTIGVTVTPPVPVVGVVTFSEMLAARVGPPPVPVTVTVAGPVVAVHDAVKLRVLLLPVVDPGLKAAVTPAGKPVALKTTLAVKLVRVMLIALVAELRARQTRSRDSQRW